MRPIVLKDIVFAAVVILVTYALESGVNAATYFISPRGSDVGLGTASSSPWRTFAYAVSRLKPGDKLVLQDGTYDNSNSGLVNIVCGVGVANGTAEQRITLKAENERQAWIRGMGAVVPFQLRNCSYWVIEGLRISSADNPATKGAGSIVNFDSVADIIFRKNLLHNNNRYRNGSAITSDKYVNGSLIEENEVYNFHRNGIAIKGAGNVLRRNYINSRSTADVLGGRQSGTATRGDSGIVLYPASNTIVENNVSENNGSGFEIQAAYGIAADNSFVGNLSVNDNYGFLLAARKENSGVNQMPQNTTLENNIVINPGRIGVYVRGNKNTHIRNTTVNGGAASDGVVADGGSGGAVGDGMPTVYSENVLVLNTGGQSFKMVRQYDWHHDYSGSYKRSRNGAAYGNEFSDRRYRNKTSIDPQLGSCIVFVPESSPMKHIGKNGSDIGANVLYRYQNGKLSNQPLWNSVTGEFPHGAIVPGINDIAGSSAFDLHKRLNVNTNGCSLPAGYGSSAAR